MTEKLAIERQQLVDEIIKLMERDDISWQKTWRNRRTPINPITDKAYRGSNNLRLMTASLINDFKDPRWMTFKQAKDKGYQIKKGEKATPIYYYQLTDKKTKKVFDEMTIKDLVKEEKNEYLQKNVYMLTKKYSLFNAQQIEGIEKYEENIINTVKRNDLLDKILDNSEAKIYYDQLDKAFYNLEKDIIHLPEKERFNSIESVYSVALHEMAHSTGHSKRLNRDMTGKFGDKNYAKEELIAEFSSIFIAQETGLKTDEEYLKNSAAYLKEWNKLLKENPEVLFEAIKEAQKIEYYILEPYRKELENIKENKTIDKENTENDRISDKKIKNRRIDFRYRRNEKELER